MRFEFTVLGSNAAVPAYGRNPSAHMLNIYEKIYLLDCGEGTQMQLNLFNFNKNKIQVIFITHLHGDHCFGLPGLLTSMSLNKRVTELVIFSPPGLQQMIAAMLHYSQTEPSFVIRYEEVDTEQHQKIYENEQVEVFSIPLEHRISTTGYLFLEKQRKQKIRKEALEKYNLPTQILNDVKQGANFTTENGEVIPNHLLVYEKPHRRSFAYCTDTVFLPNTLPDFLQNVDLLYHESTFLDDLSENAKITKHSTAKQAALIAAKANVKKLIIGHFSSRYQYLTPLLKEAEAVFPNTELAKEGKTWIID